MSVTVALHPSHGLVPLVVAASTFVHVWAAAKVGSARKKYNIEYPQMYAEQSDKNAKAFNCVQRAHQHTVENLPVFYAVLFPAAIYRPIPAAILGTIRVIAFVVYISGYSSGDPAKRNRGAFGHVAVLALVGLAVEASLKTLGWI